MRTTFALLLALGLLAVPSLHAATCPSNIPVVTLPPQQVGGFSWAAGIRPMGDACVTHIGIEKANDSAWYVGGQNGLYMTKNAGQTWTHPLNGVVGALLIAQSSVELIYVGIGNKLYLSRDHGQNWTIIRTFGIATVSSLLVTGPNGSLVVGLSWSTHAVPSGVWVGLLGAGLGQFHAYGQGQTGLITHTLSRDPISGAIYAGTEIFDHLPQPYHPPFFRSDNGGVMWKNVAGTLPWHVIASVVRPTDGWVFALTEGSGLFVSANKGLTWHPLAKNPAPSDSLLMDPKIPTRLFGGRQKFGNINGGIFVSTNAGQAFQPIGLQGATVAGLAMNGAATKIYAAVYASGVYVSPVP
jgi:hypothetical protein